MRTKTVLSRFIKRSPKGSRDIGFVSWWFTRKRSREAKTTMGIIQCNAMEKLVHKEGYGEFMDSWGPNGEVMDSWGIDSLDLMRSYPRSHKKN